MRACQIPRTNAGQLRKADTGAVTLNRHESFSFAGDERRSGAFESGRIKEISL